VDKFPNLKNAQNSYQFLHGAVSEHEGFEVHDMVVKFSDNVLLELALMVGVVHIIISFLRYLDRHWAGIGWIVALIGAYLFIPHFIDSTSIVNFAFGADVMEASRDGLYMMIGGFLAAVTLSIIQHRWMGLLEPMHVIQIFADAMSYLRLYALGFAGAVVVETLNNFASSTNVVFGALLLIFGNLMNITLAVMAGIIHGLRLNFLEWYHYSFEGGGKNYDPLRKLDYD
jgi:V/A-type H+-transporting ATPase subunit I